MSTWTHVNASFRFDALRIYDTSEPNWYEVFGKSLDDEWDCWDEYEKDPLSYLPTGTEGSCKISSWANPDTHCLSAYTINVFGDLRDYEWEDCENYLDKWFEQCCKNSWVRQAVCEYICGFKHIILVWDNHKEGVKRMEL